MALISASSLFIYEHIPSVPPFICKIIVMQFIILITSIFHSMFTFSESLCDHFIVSGDMILTRIEVADIKIILLGYNTWGILSIYG